MRELPVCIVIGAVLVSALGCAKLTPSHSSSGWRSDGEISDARKAPERVRAIALRSEANFADALSMLDGRPIRAKDTVGAKAAGMAAAAEFAAKQLMALLAKEMKKAAALHVASFEASSVEETFYEDVETNADINLLGVLATRELALTSCQDSGLPPARNFADGSVLSASSASSASSANSADEALEWCLAFAAVFEVDGELAADNGIFRLRLKDGAVALYRSRAKVVSPAVLAPWTWWLDDAHNKWWAPTKGTKNYLDSVRVTLSFEPVETSYMSDELVGKRESSWTFQRLPFRCAPELEIDKEKRDRQMRQQAEEPETDPACNKYRVAPRDMEPKIPAAYAEPLSLIPVGKVLLRAGPNQPVLKSGQGGYVLRAKITEGDSAADRFGDMAELVEKHEEEALKWVQENVGSD